MSDLAIKGALCCHEVERRWPSSTRSTASTKSSFRWCMAPNRPALVQSSAHDNKLALWHRRLRHFNVKNVQALCGMDLSQSRIALSSFICEGCIEGKQDQLLFPVDGTTQAPNPLELVHSDVCGPMKTTSIGGAKYFVPFIDHFSRKIWLYPIKTKSECFHKFKEFKAFVENQLEKKIKV